MARVCSNRNQFYYLNKNSTSRNELTSLNGATLYTRSRTRRLLIRSPTTMLTTCDTVCPRCRHVFPVQATLPSPTAPTAPSIPLAVLSTSRPMSNFPSINSLIAGVPSTTVQSTEFQQIPVHNNAPQLCGPLLSHPVSSSTLSLPPSHCYTSNAGPGCHPTPSTFHVYPSQLSNQSGLTSLPLGYQEIRPSVYCYPTIPSPTPTYGLDVHQFSLHSLHSGSTLPQLPVGMLPGPKLNLSPPPRYTKGTRTMRQLSGGCLVDRSKNDETITIHEPRVTRQLSGGGLIDSTDENFIRADEPQVSPSLPLMSLPLRSSLTDECEYLTSDDCDVYGGLTFESKADLDRNTITDRETLSRTLTALRMSGWFYEGIGWQDSETMLRSSPDGTFIVRESSNPSYLFALTIRTPRNPTSIRVQYIDGKFRLDCTSNLTPEMPQFECVVALIEHYVTNGARNLATFNDSNTYNDSACRRKVLIDSEGTIYSPVCLRRPLLKKDAVPSLMHLTRLAVNKAVGSDVAKRELPQKLESLELPICLKRYLLEYPYTI